MGSARIELHEVEVFDQESMRNNRDKNHWSVFPFSVLRYMGLAFLASLLAYAASGQATSPDSAAADPVALVRRAVANELKSSNGKNPYRYKLHKIDDGRSTTKEIVETKDGDVARLLDADGHPLGPEANQTELERLNNLLAHPEIQEHRRKREQADSNRANEMIRLLPDAFLYHFEGMAQGPSGPAVRLSLKPNPNFHPPDREAEVYAGMAGELWIDQRQERMVKLDVHLIADVNFGWGILGKLYKGGSILVEQEDVGNDHWEQNHFKLDLHGKALLFKSLDFETTEDETDFAPVPADWTYQDAVKLLLTLKPSETGSDQLSQR
jgi:hypothetical protein